MFVKPADGGWRPVYIGIADDLRDRIAGHERWQYRWADAVARGATKIMAHTQSNSAEKITEEKTLIAHYDPHLNTQNPEPAAKCFG